MLEVRARINPKSASGRGLLRPSDLRTHERPYLRRPPPALAAFWSAALGDLKGNKSRAFGFNTKVKLEKDVPMEWFNYQKDVMSSGALGIEEKASGIDLDNGDFVGF